MGVLLYLLLSGSEKMTQRGGQMEKEPRKRKIFQPGQWPMPPFHSSVVYV